MQISKEELEAISKAIAAAQEAYNNVFKEADLDQSYFPMDITVRVLDANFDQPLAKITFEDLG